MLSQIRKEAIEGLVPCVVPMFAWWDLSKPRKTSRFFFTNKPRFEQGNFQTQMSWERNAADCVHVQVGVSK